MSVTKLLTALALTAVMIVPGARSGSAWANDAQLLQRGAYLMNSIVACGNCHVQRNAQGRPLADKGLSGGMVFDEEPFRAIASNITPDRETGIGSWTDAQLMRAIREGIRPDGSLIGPPMPIGLYRNMADEDLRAIVAWLRAQPAVKNEVAKSEYRMPLPAAYGPPITVPVAAPPRSASVAYGAYLAGPLGHCVECHTPLVQGQPDTTRLGAGGNTFKGPWGVAIAANLTPHETGLKGWSDAQIEHAIREGKSHDGRPLLPPMAYDWYRNIDTQDMKALISYLRSLKPLPKALPEAKP